MITLKKRLSVNFQPNQWCKVFTLTTLNKHKDDIFEMTSGKKNIFWSHHLWASLSLCNKYVNIFMQ